MNKIFINLTVFILIGSMLISITSPIEIKANELDSNYGEYQEIEGETCIVEATPKNNLRASSFSLPSLPNDLLCSITPQSNSYKISFINVGLDPISKIDFYCEVKTNSGTFYAATSKTLKNIKVGVTSYTWNLPKGKTVQEKINISGTGKDGSETFIISASTVRYNFAGGQYGTMNAYDGQRHHMPSNAISPLSSYKGPCLRMITSEHLKTSSYGSSASASAFRTKEKNLINNGKFLAAQQLGVTDVQKKFGKKYNAAINDMIAYTKGLGYTK